MNDPYEFVPPFISPLTHDQHARLGRIALLWGQIDMVLDQLLQVALGITGKQRQSLIGERPIGGKLDLLKNNLTEIQSIAARDLAEEFWDLANQTKSMRNRCFHGIWGFGLDRRAKKIVAAAAHFKELENPVRASQLPALEKKLCKTARCGWDALAEVNNHANVPRGCNRMFHGKGEAPPWLGEWIEQHPLGDDDLDRKHKRGQLPYLTKPL